MKCPKCGAQLHDDAQFCFYCMHKLVDKKCEQSLSKPKNKKRIFIWTCCVVVCALLMVALVFVIRLYMQSNLEESTIPKDPIIATFDDFQLRATYLTGKDGLSNLWDPDSFVLTHTGTDKQGDTWQIYSADVFVDEADLRLYFCEGGTEIIVSLTDLTDETIDEGLQVIECAVSSIYNHRITNLHDMLADHEQYPLFQISPDEQMLRFANLPDPAWDKQDAHTEASSVRNCAVVDSDENQLMYIEIRTRTYEGTVYYDFFVLHTLAEEN